MVIINDNKINPTKEVINNINIQIIYIPLETSTGYVYKLLVKIGDYVCIGTKLGSNPVIDIPLISSVSGTVVGIEEKYLCNNKRVKCLVIENDFKDKYLDKIGKTNDLTKYSKAEFISLLKKCAITGLSGNGFPTYIKYDTDKEIKYLLVNGCECDILASSDSAVMYHHSEDILECIDAIMEIMDIPKAYIAISEDNEIAIHKLLKHINTYPNIKIYPVSRGYPNGYERLVVAEVLGLTYDKIPLEINTIVENVSTIYAIYEALKYHKPLIERVVTITGEGIIEPANYLLKIGTDFNEFLLKTNLLKNINNPILIAGGLMMGHAIESDELIITKEVNAVVIKSDIKVSPVACINCGKCSEVCPVNLIPSLIIKNRNKAKNLRINRCINCGLCSYVCPSKIDIREEIKRIKEEL